MRNLYWAAVAYTVLGLAGGLFFREYTKSRNFTGTTQLAVLHTHLLALGMLFFLIMIALERLLSLSASRLFPWFFWIYNLGLLWTTAFMTVIGIRQVQGKTSSAALDGMAGTGHILLTIALACLLIVLHSRLFRPARQDRGAASGTPFTAPE